jgi:hypothetical protein
MGGWGSGRHGSAGIKRQADGSYRLSAPPAWMVEESRGVYIWSKFGFAVWCEIERQGETAANVSLRFPAGLGRQRVGAVATPANLGGRLRWWWLCPGCSRRCLKLYLPPRANLFGCRLCHDLSYESAQSSRQRYYELFKASARQCNPAGPHRSYLRSIGIRPTTATHFRERCREAIGGFTVAPYAGVPRRWPSD